MDENTKQQLKHAEKNLIDLDSSDESDESCENFGNCDEVIYLHDENNFNINCTPVK